MITLAITAPTVQLPLQEQRQLNKDIDFTSHSNICRNCGNGDEISAGGAEHADKKWRILGRFVVFSAKREKWLQKNTISYIIHNG
jgi:hypothetical protein